MKQTVGFTLSVIVTVTLLALLYSGAGVAPAAAQPKTLDGKAIAAWLKKNRVDTIQGQLQFGGATNYGDDLMRIKQVQDGKWVVVWPKQYAPPGVALRVQ